MLRKNRTKRALSLILALMMMAILLPAIPAMGAEAGDIIFSEDFETGNKLEKNGDGEMELSTEQAAGGKQSLKSAPANNGNYHGLKIPGSKAAFEGGATYRLTAKAFSKTDAKVTARVETTDASGTTQWEHKKVAVDLLAGKWVDVTLDFDIPVQNTANIAIINSEQTAGLVFYLDDVKIELVALPVPPAAGDLEMDDIKITFDNASIKDKLTAQSASKYEMVADFGQDDKASLKGWNETGNFTGAENAVRLTLDKALPANGIYKISYWVYVPEKGNEGKDTLTGPGFVINGNYSGGTGESKFPVDFGTIEVGTWKQVEVTLPVATAPITTLDFRFVENSEPKHPNVWYIDNIVISLEGSVKVEVAEWDLTLPSLVKTYQDYFLLGNIMSHDQLDADTTAMFKHHYNVVTAENAMKPIELSKEKDKYDFSKADAIVEWAQANNMKIVGHTLVWHSQSSDWLTKAADGKPLTRAEAKTNMTNYINTVAGRYAGKLISWDVVNEAFADGKDFTGDWRDVLRDDSPWYMAYANGADASKGEHAADYIYDAFVLARKVDPKAVLYFNEYNEELEAKREGIVGMVNDLNAKWKNDPQYDGRMLIEGIGMQSHHHTEQVDSAAVDIAITRFAETGAEVSVTELDNPGGSWRGRVEDRLEDQAEQYAQLFEVYKKHADVIERITFWGKADPQSWRKEGAPLLFDKLFEAKGSYYAVIDPAKYLVENWKNPFGDIKADAWYYKNVAYTVSNKLMVGTSETMFNHAGNVTWGQFLTILFRLDGQLGETTGANWSAAPVKWAADNGIAANIDVSKVLSRQDMAIMIANYLKYADITLAASSHSYADSDKIAANARDAAGMLYSAGIITGKPGNLFDPLGNTNRAEVATIVERLIKSIQVANTK